MNTNTSNPGEAKAQKTAYLKRASIDKTKSLMQVTRLKNLAPYL